MILGEIVEILIRIHDGCDLTMVQDDAVCAACNILDRLPAQMDEETAKETLRKLAVDYKTMEVALKDSKATLDKMQGAGGRFCDEAEEIKSALDTMNTQTDDDRDLLNTLNLPYHYDREENGKRGFCRNQRVDGGTIKIRENPANAVKDIMWAFLMNKGQKANVPALKEYVYDLIQMTTQKTAGQGKHALKGHIRWDELDMTQMSIVIEATALVLSGELDKLTQSGRQNGKGKQE